MRQRRPAEPGRCGAGQVERLHRAAFGQAVALVGRDADAPAPRRSAARRPPHRRRRRASATPARAGRVACSQAGPGAQHLRQQDQAVRLRAPSRWRGSAPGRSPTTRVRPELRPAAARCRSRPATAAPARRRCSPAAPRTAARSGGAGWPAARAPAPGRRPRRAATRAPRHTPLGVPVVPEVKVILTVPGGHRHRRGRAGAARRSELAGHARSARRAPARRPLRPAARRSSASAPAGLQRVGDLLRREEAGQRQVHHAGLQRGEVGDDPGRAVVQQRGEHAHLLLAQMRAEAPRPAARSSANVQRALAGLDADAVVAEQACRSGRHERRHSSRRASLRRARMRSASGRWPASTTGRCS